MLDFFFRVKHTQSNGRKINFDRKSEGILIITGMKDI